MLLGQLANAAEDQVRLDGRSAGRIDDERDGSGVTKGKCAIEGARNGGKR